MISDQLPIKEFSNKVKELTDGGVNVVFDPVGGDTFMKCFKSIKWNANIIFSLYYLIKFMPLILFFFKINFNWI